MNAPEIQAQIADRNGRAAQLAQSGRPDGEIIRELFLAAYARDPSRAELRRFQADLRRAPSRQRALEDLIWALLNSPEFVFNR
jgi:hypothetical protein